MKYLIVTLILFGCTSSAPLTFERYDQACKNLCKDLYKSDVGGVSRVTVTGISCYCGEQ